MQIFITRCSSFSLNLETCGATHIHTRLALHSLTSTSTDAKPKLSANTSDHHRRRTTNSKVGRARGNHSLSRVSTQAVIITSSSTARPNHTPTHTRLAPHNLTSMSQVTRQSLGVISGINCDKWTASLISCWVNTFACSNPISNCSLEFPTNLFLKNDGKPPFLSRMI